MKGRDPHSVFQRYTLRDEAGRHLRTQSTRLFQSGQCVRLWHAPQMASGGLPPQHDFVAGTLEASRDCTAP